MSVTDYPALSLSQTQNLARKLAACILPGDVITLNGEVGAGKTTFARAFIQTLCKSDIEVTSPTFTLMQSYAVELAQGKKETLWHLDLYRLKDVQELHALGLEELWPSIVLMEWPEIAQAFLPQNRLNILFNFGDTDETRNLEFTCSAEWKKRLETIK